MVKRKDYFSAIVMGTIWGLFCLGLSIATWWLGILVTENNTLAAYILAILCFCLGIYKGKEFYHVELRTVKKDDPQTDWRGVLDNIQILLLASMLVNCSNVFNDGFTWAGLGVFVFGLLFIWIMIYLKNTRFEK